MKFFTNKETTKKMIIAILLVMSFNFISPTISQAADFGGALFKPISQLLLGISDLVIKGMQKYFTGVDDIKYGGIQEIESDSFFIRYSPGIIFSGKIAGLKVNFIDAKESDSETTADETYSWDDSNKGPHNIDSLPGFSDPNFDRDEVYSYVKTTDDNWYELTTTKVHIILTWEYNGKTYTAVNTDADWNAKDYIQSIYQYITYAGVALVIPFKLIEGKIADTGNQWNLYTLQKTPNRTVTKQSSAYILQDTVATWYKALRAIALVGLLSVLVYVGIRILISSTGQEKAKYKKMIGDWVAAICILFVLQYIMLFITEITQKITDTLAINIVGPNGEDILMSNLRNNVGESEKFSEMFPELLMYIVLVIYTVMFTIQYLKRLLYMAFFTMIAPLISLTYPLDKIKDGQAQAFTMWIREYIFNALLQPMHLLLYYIFVSSAMNLVNQNPLYAVAAIGFLLPAEKFFRKMFGFDKASSAGQLGAAAGGALIMNAINKMGQRSGKQLAGKAEGSGGSGGSVGGPTPRYISAPNSGGGSGGGQGGIQGGIPGGGQGGIPGGIPGGGQGGIQGGIPGGSQGGIPGGIPRGSQGGIQGGIPGGIPGGGQGGIPGGIPNSSLRNQPNAINNMIGSSGSTFGQKINSATYGKSNIRSGVRTLSGHYFNRGNFGKNGKVWKAARRGIRGLAGAATLGTVGLAAGVATGDLGNALKYGAAGAGAGYVGANHIGDKAEEFVNSNKEIYREGALGTDEYNTRNSINELTNDNDFNRVCKQIGITKQKDREALIRQFHSNGITKGDDIKKAINAGASIPNPDRNEIIAAAKIKQEAQRYGHKKKDIEEGLIKSGVPSGSDELRRAMQLIDLL